MSHQSFREQAENALGDMTVGQHKILDMPKHQQPNFRVAVSNAFGSGMFRVNALAGDRLRVTRLSAAGDALSDEVKAQLDALAIKAAYIRDRHRMSDEAAMLAAIPIKEGDTQ